MSDPHKDVPGFSRKAMYKRMRLRLGIDKQGLSGKRVVDVGTAQGGFLAYLYEFHGCRELIGIEPRARRPMPPMIQSLVQAWESWRYARSRIVCASGIALPLRDACADLVVYHGSFYRDGSVVGKISEEECQRRSLREAWRVVRPGGEIRIYPYRTKEANADLERCRLWTCETVSVSLEHCNLEMKREDEKGRRFYLLVLKKPSDE